MVLAIRWHDQFTCSKAFKEKGLLKRSAMLALSFGMRQDKLEEIGEV